ncbi:MAG: T9SS type A sorting domain-containing protein [Flavipsychrobacter sp.]|nr:T9SS type A sorting domain-containing protein [Flavipsychrobacter sp.]
MKKLFLALFCCLSASAVFAQSFITQKDTAYATVMGTASVYNKITNITSSDVTIEWKVIDHDFPADWSGSAQFAVCDYAACNSDALGILNGNPYTPVYPAGVLGDFHLLLDLTGTSYGSHYLVVELKEGANQTKNIVFVISRYALSVAEATEPSVVSINPNPASGVVRLQGALSASLFNIQGRKVAETTNGTFDVSGLAAGLYIVESTVGGRIVRSRLNVLR